MVPAPGARVAAILCALPLLIALVAPAAAQYLFIDTDGDGASTENDVIRPSEATILDIWLRTDANRDETAASCPDGGAPLVFYGYSFVLQASNGTVAWNGFVNRIPEFTIQRTRKVTATQYLDGFEGPVGQAPGAYRLGSLTVTVASGTPSVAILASFPGEPQFTTSFYSACPGRDRDHYLKLGLDWFDADGVEYGGVANRIPVLKPPADMTAAEGSVVEQPLRAEDGDGQPLAFVLDAGPPFVAVTTVDAGSGNATGSLLVAPGYFDSGVHGVTVSAGDGIASDARSLTVTVANVNRAPILKSVEDMMAGEGSTTGMLLYANDADADDLEFTKAAGPLYMTVTTLRSETGTGIGDVRLAPGYSDAGMETGSVRVSDGVLSDTRVFNIMVRNLNRPPVLGLPAAQTVLEGELLTVPAAASDPDGEIPALTASGLPPDAAFEDHGGGAGSLTWVPRFDQAGSHVVTVEATDPLGGSDEASTTIQVEDRAAGLGLAQPLDMALAEGETAEQPLHAMDAEGRPLAFAVAFGPWYLSVSTEAGAAGLAAGFVRLAPGYYDAGDATATIAVRAGLDEERRSFRITVRDRDGAAGREGLPFAPPFSSLATGSTPHTVAIGDVNRDGVPDLINTNLGSNSVSVMLGVEHGGFGPRMSYATGRMPHTVALGDFNRDGLVDLAVTNMGDTSVGILPGLGDGTFGPRSDFDIGGSPMFLGLGDFDRDGALDIATTDQSHGTAAVLLGAGDGTFRHTADYETGEHCHGLAIGDLNRDGAADLVVANDEARTVSVLLGNGDGTLAPKLDFTTSSPHTVSIGHLDTDGIPDVVVANFGTSTVSILLGNGDGTFRALGDLFTGAGAHGTAISDLDHDGLGDLAVANQLAHTLSILRGRGDGTFQPRVDFAMGSGAHSIAVGDLNGDGASDLAVSSIYSNTLTLLLNLRPIPAGERVPTAEAGGPYRAGVGEPVTFDARASSDPDGDPLTYWWSFGDRVNGAGARPVHAYDHAGRYRASVLVSDGYLAAADSAVAIVEDWLPTRAFLRGGERSVPLGAGMPLLEVRLEPLPGSFAPAEIDPGSIVMRPEGSTGDPISCVTGKGGTLGDTDRNGIEEVAARFARDDVAGLMTGLEGRRTVTLVLEGSLASGAGFRALLDLTVVATGRGFAASLGPNPVNPEAVLSVWTSRPGPLRVSIYDVGGRRIRELRDGTSVPGYHEIRFDGRADDGARLASGVYFYRVEAAEGALTGRFAILK